MTRTASVEQIREFWDKCLSVLDAQVFELSSEEAKKCSVQAVMRCLRSVYVESGEEAVLELIKYPRRIESYMLTKKDEIFCSEDLI